LVSLAQYAATTRRHGHDRSLGPLGASQRRIDVHHLGADGDRHPTATRSRFRA
jgi:hypothetical protein